MEVSLQVPLEDRDNWLVKLGKILDLIWLIKAIDLNDAISLIACESIEADLYKILALLFKGLVLTLQKMIFAVFGDQNRNLESTRERVLLSVIDVDLWEANHVF